MIIRQVSAELRRCGDALNDRNALLDACKTAARKVGASIVGEGSATYQPHGTTVIVFLAESHIMITTWPELNLALVDVLLCNPQMNLEDCLNVIKAHICPDGDMHIDYTARVIATERVRAS